MAAVAGTRASDMAGKSNCRLPLVVKISLDNVPAQVSYSRKLKSMHIGGRGEFNAMQTLLAALAACDVDLIVLHAALLGVEVKDLRVEATGHFNVQAYLGLDAPGSGYTGIYYKVMLNAPDLAPRMPVKSRSGYCASGSSAPLLWVTPLAGPYL